MRQLYNRRNIVLGYLLLVLLLSAFMLFAYRDRERTITETQKVDNTLRVLRIMEDIMDDMQDIETAQRGYVLTRDSAYLVPYNQALSTLNTDTVAVMTLAENTVDRRHDYTRLVDYVRKKIDFAEGTVQAVDRGQFDSAIQRVRSGYGRMVMDSIRSILSRIEYQDDRSLQDSNYQRKVAADSTAKWLIALVASLLIVMLLLSVRVFRDLKLKEANEQKVLYLASLTENTSDAVISVDTTGKILSWNNGASRQFGFSKEESLGKNISFLTNNEQRPENWINLAIAENQEWTCFRKNNESLHCMVSITPLYAGSEVSGHVLILRDMMSNEALRKLTGYLQTIREEERTHMAREIHDELGQQLTVLKMGVSWLKKKINTDDEKIQEKLTDLVQMIDTTVQSVRKISSELRPSILDDLGLQAAIEWQAQEFEKGSGIKVNAKLGIHDIKLPGNVAITFFRIFQESLTNIGRHAEASEVKVQLGIEDQRLEMQVRDNGKGYSPLGIQEKRTLGLLGMKERAALINGEVQMTTEPGKGTTVKVSVPI